jgi:hypothetical protein
MSVDSPVTRRVAIRFSVDPCVSPDDAPIHDALRSLQAFEVEAPTSELAELYGMLLLEALERAGN